MAAWVRTLLPRLGAFLRRTGILASPQGSSWRSCPASRAAAELVPWDGGAKPALDLEALDRAPTGLGDHAGRPVIVHFFATWCAPCVQELPALARLAERWPREELGIIAVDVGEVPARVRRFLAEHPVGFPVLLDQDRAATRAWEVIALPSSFVLDAAHRPVLYAEGDVDWDDPAVDAALGELIGRLQWEVKDDDEPA